MKILNPQSNSTFTDNQENIIVSTKSENTPTKEYVVILSVYDMLDNFLFEEKIKPEEFKFEYESEEEFVNAIQNFVKNEEYGLNPNGKYKIIFNFVTDVFGSISQKDHTFLVTEISPNRKEVRLNPLSNNSNFVNTFQNFKDYYSVIDLSELSGDSLDQFIEPKKRKFLETVINNFLRITLTEESIQSVIDSAQVQNKKLVDYLREIYEGNNDEFENILTNLVKKPLESFDGISNTIRFYLERDEKFDEKFKTYISDISPVNFENLSIYLNDQVNTLFIDSIQNEIDFETLIDIFEPPSNLPNRATIVIDSDSKTACIKSRESTQYIEVWYKNDWGTGTLLYRDKDLKEAFKPPPPETKFIVKIDTFDIWQYKNGQILEKIGNCINV